jgi:hypothetical protein
MGYLYGSFDGEGCKYDKDDYTPRKRVSRNDDNLSMIQMKGKKYTDENPSVSNDDDDFHMSNLRGRDD